MSMPELKLVGAYGSPYSRKMRAVLRYRHIPFQWLLRENGAKDVPPVPVALIPVLVFPGESGGAPTASAYAPAQTTPAGISHSSEGASRSPVSSTVA